MSVLVDELSALERDVVAQLESAADLATLQASPWNQTGW